jgi:hypothetical protein
LPDMVPMLPMAELVTEATRNSSKRSRVIRKTSSRNRNGAAQSLGSFGAAILPTNGFEDSDPILAPTNFQLPWQVPQS